MNEYRFSDLKIGQSEAFTHVITADEMAAFCRTTGDRNPLHIDKDFAQSHGFASNVVYGMLTASLISTLGGMYLPGKYCLIQQVETKFLAPVYEGDELEVIGTVKELNESVQQAVIKVEIKRAGKKVVRGSLYVGFLE